MSRYFGVLGLLIISSILSLPAPAITGYIVDKVFIRKNPAQLSVLVGLLLTLLIVSEIVRAVQEYQMFRLSQEFIFSIRLELLDRILRYPLSFFKKFKSGYLVSRLDEANQLGNFFSVTVLLMAENLVRFVGAIFLISCYNLKLTLISLAILPLFFEVARRSRGALRITSLGAMEQSATTRARIQETLAGIELIKTFSKEAHETSRIKESLRQTMDTEIIQNLLSSISGRILGLIIGANLLAILWFGGHEIMAGRLSVGQYVAFVAYIGYLYGPVQLFSITFLAWQKVFIACKRIGAFMADTAEDENPERTYEFRSLKGEVRFQNVSYHYGDGQDVLHNISFFIPKGDTVAFVGKNGAGKSTIIHLVLGLYTPTLGRIEIDGVDLRCAKLQSLRDRTGIVSQNIFLFDDTILNNLKYGRPEAGMEEVIAAAKASGCNDFISQLPRGYETSAGELGNCLSGGEKQRISIARCLLKNPDLVIFDEPTSNLDPDSTRILVGSIRQLFRAKTCIIISHNLSKVSWVDRIFVLDGGRIVQTGKHEDLIKEDGQYRNLCESA